ncbi:MAG: hypothetical protein JWP09_364 [Candidatus Taylorbacteria bacterium]|nr:hypothetical protein [Candidatus Taylorbacteria bacterium]
MIAIILLSLLGAVIAAVVGTFWYSNSTPMGKIQMKTLGCDNLTPAELKKRMEDAKPMMGKMYAAQILLSFLTSFAVSLIVVMGVRNGLTFGMALGFILMNWLCFIVPTIGSGILWSNTDKSIRWPRFFSEIGANLLTILLVAIIASFFI